MKDGVGGWGVEVVMSGMEMIMLFITTTMMMVEVKSMDQKSVVDDTKIVPLSWCRALTWPILI